MFRALHENHESQEALIGDEGASLIQQIIGATCLILLLPALRVYGMPYDVIPARYKSCCDVNLDGAVDMNDAHQIAVCFGLAVNITNWSSANDVDLDQVVNMLDLYIVILVCNTWKSTPVDS